MIIHRTNIASVLAILLLAASARGDEAGLLKTDSRAAYVHRINLYDEDDNLINPKTSKAPYSPRNTCAKCHDYAQASGGWHFNAFDRPESNVMREFRVIDYGRLPGRPGEPWILADRATGTQIPFSARSWPGAFKPADLGMTSWQFVQTFGRHMPGGGPGEQFAEALPDQKARWKISGQLQIDCMLCHSADPSHDQAERARQIDRHNFRWAPAAAMGLAVVRRAAKDAVARPTAPDDLDEILRAADPAAAGAAKQADQFIGGPKLEYDLTRFDANDRVFFDITRTPPVQRCYFCHTSRQVGSGSFSAPSKGDSPLFADGAKRGQSSSEIDGDVHVAAGMTCTACHRNDIGHGITRGYSGGNAAAGAQSMQSLTCRGCHLGEQTVPLPDKLGGRLAAPRPRHPAFPPIHLERISCAACHSGPWPTGAPQRVQTAMAHALGIATKDRRDDDPPVVHEPVFLSAHDIEWTGGTLPPHMIRPYRMVWPAYWARMTDKDVHIVPPEEVKRQAGPAAANLSSPLTKAQVDEVLKALKAARPDEGEPIYVADGHMRFVEGSPSDNDRRNVFAATHVGRAQYIWPIAHDVRPAAQSLGSGGCTDCHSAGAPFFSQAMPLSNIVEPALLGGTILSYWDSPARIMGRDQIRAWEIGLKFRTPAVALIGLCFAATGLVVVRHGLNGLERLLRRR